MLAILSFDVFCWGRNEEVVSPPLGLSLLPLGANHPSDVLDMPVDPNEPTYCLCHQVSYGEMIGCDNQDVSRTFFCRLVFKGYWSDI